MMTGARFIDVDGIRTRYFEKGGGEALVLFHGSHFGTTDACDSAIDWELNFDRLAQWFRVIAVDKLGQGHTDNPKSAISGRGWVMVRAKSLEAGALIEAMEQGDFYASSGVTLKDVRRTSGRLAIEVQPEAGVDYVIEFFGTRRDYDRRTVAVTDQAGKVLRVTRKYSADVGALLATVKGPRGEYAFKGDELYVRARVTSTKPKALSPLAGEVEQAWVQPVVGR